MKIPPISAYLEIPSSFQFFINELRDYPDPLTRSIHLRCTIPGLFVRLVNRLVVEGILRNEDGGTFPLQLRVDDSDRFNGYLPPLHDRLYELPREQEKIVSVITRCCQLRTKQTPVCTGEPNKPESNRRGFISGASVITERRGSFN